MSFKTELDAIEEDLKKWRAGKRLHKYRIFWCAATIPGSMFLYGVFYQQPGFIFMGMVLGFLLFVAASGKMDAPDSWEGRINQALQSVSPRDKDAFEKLCRTVKEKRAIEPDDIAAWLKDEKEARALFERQRDEQQRYSFTERLDKRESGQKADCNGEGK
ncbi:MULTISPECIES: hypothetical protein [Enterobacter cloacae complex]|uniref:hypothetical protein n=1 Tax=Enterobacter cloacae complex TaxID=354276 RepID=UPI0011E42C78|nr:MULTISPECIES: hypothetical protein [Enterobacter cloacae complex]QLW24075.1 hypothetical protein HV184_25370 [Enterobacter cloacae]MDU7046952.1 hypothetical protein [Enterobacter roggenkampii]MDV0368303.1 hypothetical protein [Enterobacter chengduensis]TYF65308.1 hypothetical protein DJ544_22175 [Enterobacter roggenkampii]UNG07557.1 hypothetical protein MND42_23815 [Enterobacter asburiae]